MLTTVLWSIIYCAVCAAVFFYIENKNSGRLFNRKTAAVLLLAALAVRVYFGFGDYFFTYDMNCFKAWGSYARDLGFKNLYGNDFFLDYPPGYMYVLALLDGMRSVLRLSYDSLGANFIFKLPAIIADFGCAAVIYLFAKENTAAQTCSTICRKGQPESAERSGADASVNCTYSTAGGTRDSIGDQNGGSSSIGISGIDNPFRLCRNTPAFLAIAWLFAPNIIFNSSVWGQIESWFIFFLGLCLYFAYKNRTAFAAVAYAAALVTKPQALLFGPVLLFWIVKRRNIKDLFVSLGVGAASFYLMVLPFCKGFTKVGWLFDLYKGTFAGYDNFTVNGFNLYYFLGLNWKSLDTVAGAESINTVVICLVIALVAYIVLFAKGNSGFFAAAAVSISVMFAFCTMMHERYIYPAVLFCVMSYIARGRKFYLLFAAVISCLNYINSSWVMAMYYQTFDLNTNAEKAASLCAVVAVAGLLCCTLYDIAKEGNLPLTKLKNSKIIVGLITALYTFFALFMLGANYAPQTFYQSTDEDFSFRVHFDSPAEIGSVYVFSGLGDEFLEPAGRKVCGEFEVFTSTDNQNFDYLWNIEDQSVYTWKEYHADVTASTVLVQAKYAGSVLGEIIFCDKAGNVLNGTLDAIESTNPYGAEFALDEGDTKPAGTGYYNSMYFDEIYHGRTAYEQLEGYSIYETTHPPLGKILISIGIKLFGMTPFGWRIIGAVCGAAMIPLIYMLAAALTKNSFCGVVASALLACDFMHFTQTRIATVDTYVVLFMLLTFLFMARYHNTAFGDKKEWLCLLLSGTFMGCCVASKWNGAYPMVGLAVFLFISLFCKYRSSEKTDADKTRAVKTILFCFIAFVAVPAAIYTASFIPVIKADSLADYLYQFVQYQKHMFDYHANLEAEHFFSSMWYTWPFSIKPIWYAISESGNMVSTISAFGNPVIWALTPFAALYCLVAGVKGKKLSHLFVALGWLSSYLPWVMVSRLCFIYHYFPCAVFGIAAMAMAAADLVKIRPKFKNAVWIYVGLCAVLFVIFLPVTSGIPTPKWYIEALEILPQWYFVN